MTDKKGLVYLISSCNDDECYIGSTVNFGNRKRNHYYNCNTPSRKHYYYPLYEKMREVGIDTYAFTVLEDNIPQKKLLEREKYYIDEYNPQLNKKKIN